MGSNLKGTLGSAKINVVENVIPDWNQNDPNAKDYVKNRPGGYKVPTGMVIEFDGNIEGLQTKTVDASEDRQLTLYKISDINPLKEQFIGAEVAINGDTLIADLNVAKDGTYGITFDHHDDDSYLFVSLICDGDPGVWLFFNGTIIAFTVTQTYTGYVGITQDRLGDGIPHSKLLNRGTYSIQLAEFNGTESEIALKAAIKSGDYDNVSLMNGSSGRSATIDQNSDFVVSNFKDGSAWKTRYSIRGIDFVLTWIAGETEVLSTKRYVEYSDNDTYKQPGTLIPIRSSTAGSTKVFYIAVDDDGVLSVKDTINSSSEPK